VNVGGFVTVKRRLHADATAAHPQRARKITAPEQEIGAG
jgi:hypothetical protein